MPIAHINGTPYEVDAVVYDTLVRIQYERDVNYAAAVNLKAELDRLRDLVRQASIKQETATKHPTKATKLQAYKSRMELYGYVGIEPTEKTLF